MDSWRTVLADQHCGPPSDPLADLRTRLISLQLSVRLKGRAPGPSGTPPSRRGSRAAVGGWTMKSPTGHGLSRTTQDHEALLAGAPTVLMGPGRWQLHALGHLADILHAPDHLHCPGVQPQQYERPVHRHQYEPRASEHGRPDHLAVAASLKRGSRARGDLPPALHDRGQLFHALVLWIMVASPRAGPDLAPGWRWSRAVAEGATMVAVSGTSGVRAARGSIPAPG